MFVTCTKVEDFRKHNQMTLCKYWTCVLILAGMGSPHMLAQVEAEASLPAPTSDQSVMIMGPGDLIDLSVYHVPELVLKVRIDANGMVSLPLIGDLKLGGRTVRDAQLFIAQELVDRQLVKHPEVTLFIEESVGQGITVFGEVSTPGIYPLMGPHKLYDAISAAGGLTVRAGQTVTVLHGGRQEGEQVIDLSGKDSRDKLNVTVSPGDTIIVSKAGVVYVLGEVNKPGAFLMENNTSMSLMKAVALAGSTTKLASLKHAVILRKTSEGTVQIEVSLNDIYHGKSGDLQLRGEDIVFVPLSNLKNYGAMGIQAAIQAAVYAIYAAEIHN
jgi:polysaccharide export outer membrane protein